MIHLGTAKESRLEKGDVRDIEDRLDEVRSLCERELDDNGFKTVNRKINDVEFIIQRGRR